MGHWAGYAALTGFTHVTWLSVGLMTVLMILGSTTGWWTQILGMHAEGGSCLSILGSLVGGLIGTFAIPVPFLGTIIGLVLGALLFEFARVGGIPPRGCTPADRPCAATCSASWSKAGWAS